VLLCVTLPLVVATAAALMVMWPRGGTEAKALSSPAGTPPLVAATVVDVELVDCSSQYDIDAGVSKCVLSTARLDGKTNGGTLTTFEEALLSSVKLRLNDKIYVTQIGQQDGVATYAFYEFQRE
jgi:hypothetical protein